MGLEETIGNWAQPPSQGEQDRCDRTATEVRAAIAASGRLRYRNVEVFIHGSFRNRVNVRAESDVDVGVLYPDSFYPELPAGYTNANFGLVAATYLYPEFKNDVGDALVAHFGRNFVKRTNKTFEVRANQSRVDADVTPFFPYRRYDTSGRWDEGVKLVADDGQMIVNWPQQNYDNGVAKNDATGRGFKGVVRILKKLCVEMEQRRVLGSSGVCGLLIESMVYNVPNAAFGFRTWTECVREVLAVLFNSTLDDQRCAHWTETNERKLLFGPHQKWTRTQAHGFLDAAWNFLRFE
jgi:hypothetical protein